MEISQYLLNLKAKYVANAAAFQKTFGVPLRTYWDNLTGFDIVKFDEQLVKPGENESTAMAVERKWGNNAVDLVKRIL